MMQTMYKVATNYAQENHTNNDQTNDANNVQGTATNYAQENTIKISRVVFIVVLVVAVW
jgi:hypothetical protein